MISTIFRIKIIKILRKKLWSASDKKTEAPCHWVPVLNFRLKPTLWIHYDMANTQSIGIKSYSTTTGYILLWQLARKSHSCDGKFCHIYHTLGLVPSEYNLFLSLQNFLNRNKKICRIKITNDHHAGKMSLVTMEIILFSKYY